MLYCDCPDDKSGWSPVTTRVESTNAELYLKALPSSVRQWGKLGGGHELPAHAPAARSRVCVEVSLQVDEERRRSALRAERRRSEGDSRDTQKRQKRIGMDL